MASGHALAGGNRSETSSWNAPKLTQKGLCKRKSHPAPSAQAPSCWAARVAKGLRTQLFLGIYPISACTGRGQESKTFQAPPSSAGGAAQPPVTRTATGHHAAKARGNVPRDATCPNLCPQAAVSWSCCRAQLHQRPCPARDTRCQRAQCHQ